jgi:hypothetical protein
MRFRTGIALLLLGLAAVLAYAPSLAIPLMEDDYPNLAQTLNGGLATPLADPIFRVRATSFWTMWLLWRWAGLAPLAYHATSLLLHIANTWLLYGVCMAWPRMRTAAFWAAGFFAIAEGHQEAVMWFSAVNELWLFLFGMAALLCFLRRRTAAGLALFALALLSKESAAAVLPLFLLAVPAAEWRRNLVRLAPYGLLAAVAVASIFATRGYSFRFSDGSFSLHAPFWITWSHSYFRILWIWGLAAGGAILAARDGGLRHSALVALAWIGMALAPYSFLTYSTAIPSRQTYVASAGLAMLFGLAMDWWWEKLRMRRRSLAAVPAAVIVLVLAHNVGYLWFRKRPQFLARAAPTEQLIALARRTPGPIWVRCFPRVDYIAKEAAHLAAGYAPGNLVWTREEAERRHATAVFCSEEGKRQKGSNWFF